MGTKCITLFGEFSRGLSIGLARIGECDRGDMCATRLRRCAEIAALRLDEQPAVVSFLVTTPVDKAPPPPPPTPPVAPGVVEWVPLGVVPLLPPCCCCWSERFDCGPLALLLLLLLWTGWEKAEAVPCVIKRLLLADPGLWSGAANWPATLVAVAVDCPLLLRFKSR